uniref:NADH dehydrogenase subunit 5 n=1 Tax=Uenoa lobata TaxID=1958741 RepID=UPI0022DCDC2E|nr:NADH dehydrogenase subunit 5 [Uenoa lobata]UZZ44449.1 NADH dehydrogenase subunit 5 [Uenoa lobata]
MNSNLFYYSWGLFMGLVSMISFSGGNYLFFKDKEFFLEYNLFSLNSVDLVMVVLLDWMSLIFVSVVSLISSMVIFYSKSYMSTDVSKIRFLYLVLLFVFSMILMIISPNMISILLGWDGLGLVSYCLVIYYQNVKSYNAGMLTIMSNRVGDAAILIAIAWMLNFGSWNFLFYLNLIKFDSMMMMIGLMILLAGMTKSAQIPFSAWLPAAMAAPTPVSALVHSSTLVTTGVYLLIRFSPLLENSMIFNMLIYIGIITMFLSGLGANFEYDLKKIIALSTLSQLGLMMTILGMGLSNLSFLHLLTHAFFKSLLFLCAGILIHSFGDIQDIRKMGNLVGFMPLTLSLFNISNLALCGAPFLAGFYSKDLILEMSFSLNLNLLSMLLIYFSTGLTVSYSIRLLYWSYFSEVNFNVIFNFHDEDWLMIKSMISLGVLSIMSGALIMWMSFPMLCFVYIPFWLKMLVFIVIFLGGGLGMMINFIYKMKNMNKNTEIFSFLGGIWFMPVIFTTGINPYILFKGLWFKKTLEFGWSEVLLKTTLNLNFGLMMKIGQRFHFNSLKIFLLIFVIWLLVFMMMILFI